MNKTEKQRGELMEAAEQVGRDLGVWMKGRVPNWLREMGFHLHELGWRRHMNLDPREQKECWLRSMQVDLLDEEGRDRILIRGVSWLNMMATRLVEAGWVKEDSPGFVPPRVLEEDR